MIRAVTTLQISYVGIYHDLLHVVLIMCRKLGYGGEVEKELPSTGEVVLVQALGGVIAGACSAVATTPMDTVKTRLQVSILLLQPFWTSIERHFSCRKLSTAFILRVSQVLFEWFYHPGLTQRWMI